MFLLIPSLQGASGTNLRLMPALVPTVHHHIPCDPSPKALRMFILTSDHLGESQILSLVVIKSLKDPRMSLLDPSKPLDRAEKSW
jgi:hypothetical protein